ncbi:hypothetical protein [Streptomyces sanglieri]|uniref:hypothetical protein n=1 Tax=Streptomyces sanglieri TaxID=193460 RepID=UPI003525B93D
MTTTTRLATLPGATTTVDEVVDVIRRDGGVIIDGFLKPSALAELRRQLEPVLDRTRCGDDAYFAGTKTRRAIRPTGPDAGYRPPPPVLRSRQEDPPEARADLGR